MTSLKKLPFFYFSSSVEIWGRLSSSQWGHE